MNLNTLIDQWIGEEETTKLLTYDVLDEALTRNELRQDLKSRKQELVEGIENLVQHYLDKHCIDEIGAKSLLED